ncbi:MAG: hypothetical protein KH046_16560 [Stenotrophomonas maltophilia]|nr:hypothetical protein [Stenotrophomonas maltophilia]
MPAAGRHRHAHGPRAHRAVAGQRPALPLCVEFRISWQFAGAYVALALLLGLLSMKKQAVKPLDGKS